jgi:uncharacterized protein YjbJ (UPF0337 family)
LALFRSVSKRLDKKAYIAFLDNLDLVELLGHIRRTWDWDASSSGTTITWSSSNLSTTRGLFQLTQEIGMDKDRIEGAAKQAKGTIKETVGKVTGDAKIEAEGKADKTEGKVQNTVGGIKDKAAKYWMATTEPGIETEKPPAKVGGLSTESA